LVVDWPKGGIQISTIRPLPPQKVFCRYIPADCVTDHPMPNAQMWYTTSRQPQTTKVYLAVDVPPGSPLPPSCATTAQTQAAPPPARTLLSSISSSYLDDRKQPVDVQFDAFAGLRDNQASLTFKYYPPDIIVGLGTISQRLNSQQLAQIMGRLGERGISTDRANISKFTDINFSEQKLLSFDAEWQGLNEAEFLFMWGKQGVMDLTFAASSPLQQMQSSVILLDPQRKPILMTRIPMYLPAR
jgi:hypothetical protein